MIVLLKFAPADCIADAYWWFLANWPGIGWLAQAIRELC